MTPGGPLRDPARRPLRLPDDGRAPLAGRDSSAGAPLAGRAVLVLRSADRGAALAERLRAAGATVVVEPVVERAPATDPDALDAAVRDLAAGRHAWVGVTSVNAVTALADAAARTGTTLADAPARWAVVGPATRRALADAGVQAALEPDGDLTARGLVAAFAALPADDAPRPTAAPGDRRGVLLPLGDLAAPTLRDGLAALGWEPEVVTAYRTVTRALPDAVVRAWHAGEVDGVVLASGSAAREVARTLGPRDDVLAVAIGEPTAVAAREAGLRLGAVAARPTDDALADAVLAALAPAEPADTDSDRQFGGPSSDRSPEEPNPRRPAEPGTAPT